MPVALLIVGLGVVLFIGGRMVYRFGQDTAARMAGVDTSNTNTPEPEARPVDIVTSTFTNIPSPTYQFIPTATATKIPWTSCPGIVIRMDDSDAGNTVHILRCADNFAYDIGPLVRGVYAVSPDDKYLVYCGINGIIYAARIGISTLTVIHDAHREFYTFGQDMEPKFHLSFDGSYVLKVYESRYDQKLIVRMPGWLSNY